MSILNLEEKGKETMSECRETCYSAHYTHHGLATAGYGSIVSMATV